MWEKCLIKSSNIDYNCLFIPVNSLKNTIKKAANRGRWRQDHRYPLHHTYNQHLCYDHDHDYDFHNYYDDHDRHPCYDGNWPWQAKWDRKQASASGSYQDPTPSLVEGGGGALAIMPPQMQPNAVQTCTVHCFIKCDQTIVLGIALHSSEDHWRWTQQQLRGLHNILQKHIKIISKIFIELVVWCFSVDFSKIKWMQCNSALFQ